MSEKSEKYYSKTNYDSFFQFNSKKIISKIELEESSPKFEKFYSKHNSRFASPIQKEKQTNKYIPIKDILSSEVSQKNLPRGRYSYKSNNMPSYKKNESQRMSTTKNTAFLKTTFQIESEKNKELLEDCYFKITIISMENERLNKNCEKLKGELKIMTEDKNNIYQMLQKKENEYSHLLKEKENVFRLKKEITNFDNELLKKNDENENLRKQINKYEIMLKKCELYDSQKKELKEKLNLLEDKEYKNLSDLDYVRFQFQKMQTDQEKSSILVLEKINTLKNQLVECKDNLTLVSGENHRLLELLENQENESQLKHLEFQQKLQEQTKKIKNQENEFGYKLKDYQHKIDHLNYELENVNKRDNQSTEKFSRIENENFNLKNKVINLETDNRDLKRELEFKKNEISELNKYERISEVKNSFSLNLKNNENSKYNDNLKNNYNDFKSQNQFLINKNEKLISKLKNFKVENNDLHQDLQKSKIQIEYLEKNLEKLDKDKKVFSTTHEKENKIFNESFYNLERDIFAKNNKIKEFEIQIQTIQKEKDNLNVRIEILTIENKRLSDQIQFAEEKHLKRENNKDEESKEKFRIQIENLTKVILNLQREINDSKESNIINNNYNLNHEKNMEKLQEELNNLKNADFDRNRSLFILQNENEQLKNNIFSLKKDELTKIKLHEKNEFYQNELNKKEAVEENLKKKINEFEILQKENERLNKKLDKKKEIIDLKMNKNNENLCEIKLQNELKQNNFLIEIEKLKNKKVYLKEEITKMKNYSNEKEIYFSNYVKNLESENEVLLLNQKSDENLVEKQKFELSQFKENQIQLKRKIELLETENEKLHTNLKEMFLKENRHQEQEKELLQIKNELEIVLKNHQILEKDFNEILYKNEDLLCEVNLFKNNLSKIENEKNEILSKSQKYENDLCIVKDKFDKVIKENNILENKINSFNFEKEKIELENSSLLNKLKVLECECENLLNYKNSQLEKNEKNNELKKELTFLKSEMESLNQQKINLEIKHRDCRSKDGLNIANIKLLEKKLQTTESEKLALANKISNMENKQLIESNNFLTELDKKTAIYQELIHELDTLKKDNYNQQIEIKNLHLFNESQNKKLIDLETLNTNLKIRNEQLQNDIDFNLHNLENTLKEFNNSEIIFKDEKENLKKMISDKNSQISGLDSLIQELTDEINHLEKNLEEKDKKLEINLNNHRNMEILNSNLKNEINLTKLNSQKEIDILQAKLEALNLTIKNNEGNLYSFQEELNKKLLMIHQNENDIKVIRNNLEEKNQELRILNLRNFELEEEKQYIETQLEIMKSEFTNIEKLRIIEIETKQNNHNQISMLEKEKEILTKEKLDNNTAINLLQKNLNTLLEKFESLKIQYNEKIKENNNIRIVMNEKEEKLKTLELNEKNLNLSSILEKKEIELKNLLNKNLSLQENFNNIQIAFNDCKRRLSVFENKVNKNSEYELLEHKLIFEKRLKSLNELNSILQIELSNKSKTINELNSRLNSTTTKLEEFSKDNGFLKQTNIFLKEDNIMIRSKSCKKNEKINSSMILEGSVLSQKNQIDILNRVLREKEIKFEENTNYLKSNLKIQMEKIEVFNREKNDLIQINQELTHQIHELEVKFNQNYENEKSKSIYENQLIQKISQKNFLNTEIIELKNSFNILEFENQQLREENKILIEKERSFQVENAKKSSFLDQSNDNINKFKLKFQEMLSENHKLSLKNQNLTLEIKKLENRLNLIPSQINNEISLKVRLENLEQENHRLQNRVENLQREIKQITFINKDLVDKFNSSINNIKVKYHKAIEERKLLTESQKNSFFFEFQKTKKDEECKKLSFELRDREEEIRFLYSELENLTIEIDKLKKSQL